MLSKEQFITPHEILEKVASKHNLTIKQFDFPNRNTAISKSIGSFPIDNDFRKTLLKNKFRVDDREDGILTVADDNPRKTNGDCYYWNFKKDEAPHFFTPGLYLQISKMDRGVVLTPRIEATGCIGPLHQPTHNRMFKLITEHFQEIPDLLRVVLDYRCRNVTFWNEINLGGVRTIGELFEELFGDYDKVKKLANSSATPFDPNPCYRETKQLYIPEVSQPELFRQWQEQLTEFHYQLPQYL